MSEIESSPSDILLRSHHLAHIPALRVDPRLLAHRFDRACSPSACSGRCCETGVVLDTGQRDLILANAGVVQRYMDAAQERDPALWFETGEKRDKDVPSQRAAGTRVANGACVFLNAARRCVLHQAEVEVAGLKPFFCRAFPLVLLQGRVELDEEHCPEATECCASSPRGTLDVFDVFAGELRHLLGDSGAAELRRAAGR